MRTITIALIAILVAAALPATALAATFDTYADSCGDDCTTIYMNGELGLQDDMRFENLIEKQRISRAVIYLNSPGGSIDAMIGIGNQIRNAGYWTYVPQGAICVSACAGIWLAGKQRFLDADAMLGFHSTWVGTPQQPRPSPEGDSKLLTYYQRLNLDQQAIDYLLSAGYQDMSYVSINKLHQLAIDCELRPPKMAAATSSKSDKMTKATKWLDGSDKPFPLPEPRRLINPHITPRPMGPKSVEPEPKPYLPLINPVIRWRE